MSRVRLRIPRTIGAKLLAGQLLVIVAGSVTLLLAALAVGPGFFRHHVREALGFVPADVSRHLDRSFNQATLISLAIAVAAALVVAVAVSWFVSLRVGRPIATLAAAARRIAQGGYSARVPATGTDELAVLARSFNEMASSLESAERRRRELLSDVAHELRTPVATIEGYVEGISDGVIPADAEALGALRAEALRLGRLVDDLQKVSRAEERQLDLRLSAVRPANLVEAAVQAATPAFDGKGVRLEQRLEERLPEIVVDTDRMGEVLANLLENALRHTPAGGRVEIAALRRSGEVELAVADTGEGIAPQHLERVFERFYRIDRARSRAQGGSGIGLAIARAIVEAHDGRIRAESGGPELGARFVIALPAATATSALAASGEA